MILGVILLFVLPVAFVWSLLDLPNRPTLLKGSAKLLVGILAATWIATGGGGEDSNAPIIVFAAATVLLLGLVDVTVAKVRRLGSRE